MTAPRTGLFQRKPMASSGSSMMGGKPGTDPSSSNTMQAKGMGTDPKDGDNTTSNGQDGEVTCPQCGCQFDPKHPEDYTPAGGQKHDPMGMASGMPGKQMPDMNSGDLGSQIAAMMGGGK